MRRRGIGVGAIHQQQQAAAKYKEKSAMLAKEQLEKLSQQMEIFRTKLQEFATKHKKDIKKDPNFRRAFQRMCANAGVDPLQSSANFWSKMLGVGDIYYELAVQVVEICVALQHQTGGLIEINELYRRLLKSKNITPGSAESANITVEDIIKAIEKISILGNGIEVIKCNNTYLIKSLSSETNVEQNEVIKLAQGLNGRIAFEDLRSKLGWADTKIDKTLNELLMEGIVWLDEHNSTKLFWFPGLYNRAVLL